MAYVTLRPASGTAAPVDGIAGRSSTNSTFSSLRNGAGTFSTDTITSSQVTAYLGAGSTSNQFTGLGRGVFTFNTSAIPNNAIITSAILGLYGWTKYNGLGSPALHIVGVNLNSPGTVASADYSNFGSTSFANVSYASFSTSGYNSFVLNSSGRATIDVNGYTSFGAILSWDQANSFTGSWNDFDYSYYGVRHAEASGTSYDPTLTVNYVLELSASSSGTLLLSGTLSRPTWLSNRTITGTLILSGSASSVIYADTSIIEKKTFLYKIYDEDNNFLGVWDDVIDEPNWSQELNTTGSAQTVLLARNSDSLVVDVEALLDNTSTAIQDNNDFDILTTVASRNKVGPGSNVNHDYRVDIFVFYGEVDNILDNLGLPIEDESDDYIQGTIGAPNGLRRFNGFISEININYGETENTQVQLMSYGYDLDQYPVVTAGGDTTVPFNSTDPGTMVKNGLDQFASDGGGNTFITYTPATVELTGTTPSYTFRLNTYKELLETAIKLAPEGWFFYVGLGDNLVRFKPKPTTARHTFALGKHIKNLNLRSYIGDVVNDVIFTGGGDPALFKRYTETPVTGTRRGLNRLSDNRVTLEASADILSEGEIDEKKNIQYRSTVDILSKVYDIESIELGDLVAFRNFDNNVDLITMQIVAYNYTPDIISLALDTLPPTVPKRLEELRKALNAQENELVPDAPS